MNRLQALLSNELEPGLYRFPSRPAPARLCHDVTQAGWQCLHVDGRTVVDKASFLAAFGAALRFPGYFGHNWDAFEESLNDLSWLRDRKAKGILITYDDPDHFARAQPSEWATARDILVSAIASWQRAGMPMVVLLRGDSAVAAAGLETL